MREAKPKELLAWDGLKETKGWSECSEKTQNTKNHKKLI